MSLHGRQQLVVAGLAVLAGRAASLVRHDLGWGGVGAPPELVAPETNKKTFGT